MGRFVVKKGINIFSKKGFFRGGHNVVKGGTKMPPPPLTQMLSYAPGTRFYR